MTRQHVDVAVAGLGLAGSSAALAAARRGHSVAAFEAFEPGHRRGSSHGHSRIFRRAYSDPLYVELTGRAGQLWERLEADSGCALLTRVGGVNHGGVNHGGVNHGGVNHGGVSHGGGGESELMTALLQEHGVAAELFDPAQAARRWPGIRFARPVMYDPEGGVIDPEAAMAAMVRLAVAAGASVTFQAPVRDLEPDEDGIRFSAGDRSWHANTLVLATGGWTGPLLDGLVPLPPLTVTQQSIFFFAPREPGPWPTVVHSQPQDSLEFYGLPEGPLFKVGEHLGGTVTTAGSRDFTVSVDVREQVLAYVRDWLPGLDPQPRSQTTCLYTRTPQEDFVLDRRGPIVVCSPCSGHGAKFAPLIGELAADLIEGGDPVPRFALA